MSDQQQETRPFNRSGADVDRNRSQRANQIYFDRLSESAAVLLGLLRRRPKPPRGLAVRDGLLVWEKPTDTSNVSFYNLYFNTDAQPAMRVPVNQLTAKVPVGDRSVRRAWVSAVNERTGLESAKSFTEVRIPPQVVSAAPVLGNPGTVDFTPTVGEYGKMGFKDFSLVGKADTLHWDFWYVDETHIRYLWAQIDGAVGADDPVTLAITVYRKPLNFDAPPPADPEYEEFAAGDYLVIDDPDQDPDVPDHETWRRYEVFKITEVTGSQEVGLGDQCSLTIACARANLGSRKNPHAANLRLYRLNKRHAALLSKDNAAQDNITKEEMFPLSNATVVAMEGAASDLGVIGTYTQKYCQPLAYPYPGTVTNKNPAPGFRTCQGAIYMDRLFGILVTGQSLPGWIWIQEDQGIRNVVGTVGVAPVGNTATFNGVLYSMNNVALVFYVVYIEPFRRGLAYGERRVAVLEQCGIRTGEFQSFIPTDIPDFRRTPYRLPWPGCRYPVIGTVSSIYDVSAGQLFNNVLPFTATGEYLYFQESAEIDFIVALVGSTTPGSNMMVSLMS